MITLTNTPHKLGIKLSGDYRDLKALYWAIYRLVEIYRYDELEFVEYLESKEDASQNQRDILDDRTDPIYGLNYDIRHAFQGDREVDYIYNNSEHIGVATQNIFKTEEEALEEAKENSEGGNVYYSVNILYPWTIYYAIQLMHITQRIYPIDTLRDALIEYNEIEYKRDRAIVDYFISQIWLCLDEIIDEVDVIEIFNDVEEGCWPCDYFSLYPTALCNFLADPKHADEDLRVAIITFILFELANENLSSDTIKYNREIFSDIKRTIRKQTHKHIPTYESFIHKWIAYTKDKEHVYDEDADSFADKFGNVDWNNLEW